MFRDIPFSVVYFTLYGHFKKSRLQCKEVASLFRAQIEHSESLHDLQRHVRAAIKADQLAPLQRARVEVQLAGRGAAVRAMAFIVTADECRKTHR